MLGATLNFNNLYSGVLFIYSCQFVLRFFDKFDKSFFLKVFFNEEVQREEYAGVRYNIKGVISAVCIRGWCEKCVCPP